MCRWTAFVGRGVLFLCCTVGWLACGALFAADGLRVGYFEVDASPPVGSMLAYDRCDAVQTPLSCRGVVILGAGKPIVLCAIDWIGVGNDGQRLFRETIASKIDSTPDRVAVHALHQHDAPRCDFSADALLARHGAAGSGFDPVFARDVMRRAAQAANDAAASARPCTHVGWGTGVVEKVASNRRILGPDGKVRYTRWTTTKDAAVRAMPVGLIDPELQLVSFWENDQPIVALTYYATHPQSYYRTGLANPDFVGLARNARQENTRVPHVHFNGAGGNIGAGKWNDGAHENRQVLADRVAAGMKRAWEDVKKSPIAAANVRWTTADVVLPAAEHLDAAALEGKVADTELGWEARFDAAVGLAWLRRCQAGDPVTISSLALGEHRLLHLPGELFIEYQLAAKAMRERGAVAVAAYGEYAPGYIGVQKAYSQGGYETSDRASRVAPRVEGVLMQAIRDVLTRSP